MKITKKKILVSGLTVLLLSLLVLTVWAQSISFVKIVLKNLDTNTITKDFPPGTNIRYKVKFFVEGSPSKLYKVKAIGKALSLFKPDGINPEWVDKFDNPEYQVKVLHGGETAVFYWDRKIPEGATPGTEAKVKFTLKLWDYSTKAFLGEFIKAKKFNIVLPLIAPQTEILSPAPGEAVSGITTIVARDLSGQGDIKSVLFERSEHPTLDCQAPYGGWTKIGDETDNLNTEMMGIWQVAWDTTVLESKEYCIRVSMTDHQGLFGFSSAAAVSVNLPPIAKATATTTATTTIEFDASGSSDPDGTIVKYEWDFNGDGTFDIATVSTTTQHQYPTTTTRTLAVLRITDNDGATDDEFYILDFTGPLLTIARDCGCESIEIRTSGTSGAYRPNHIFQPAHTATTTILGPTTTIPQAPPSVVATSTYTIYYAFEVVAKLNPGSNPDGCAYGQEIKRTARYNATTTYKLNKAGVPYPQNQPDYTSDDYRREDNNVFVRVSNSIIRWFDAPGWHNNLLGSYITTSGPIGVTYDANFRAQVSGNTGTCQAMWDYNLRIANTGAVTTTTISNIATTTSPAKLW